MSRPFIICYICGREFGSASIGIHEPQCLKKWHQQNSLRPKEERLPPPVKPQALPHMTNGSTERDLLSPNKLSGAKNNFDATAISTTSGTLYPCPACGRTFNADRLDVHKRVCKPNNQSKLRQHDTTAIRG